MANESLLSGGINFTGLASGTDFNQLIDGLMQIERRSVDQLEIWKITWETKVEKLEELNTSLLDLRSTLSTLNTKGKFLTKGTSSSNSDAATATASSTAREGSHNVNVLALAQSEVELSTYSINDPSGNDLTSGAARVFSYTYGSSSTSSNATRNLDVPAGTTLDSLVTIINNDPNNPGVRAEKMKISEDNYVLKLVGLDQGVDKDIVVNNTTTVPGLAPVASNSWLETQSAEDALITVDGVALLRKTNSITDAIEGVTLTLKNTATNIKITVNNDKEAIKENVKTFVDKVNEIRTKLKELQHIDPKSVINTATEGYDAKEDKYKSLLEKDAGISKITMNLAGNYGTQMIEQNLKSLLAGAGAGFDYNRDPFPSLSTIGIMTEANESSKDAGMLVITEENPENGSTAYLDYALDNNIDALAELFSAKLDGSTNSTDFVFDSVVDTAEAGIYDVNYTVAGGNVTGATVNGYSASWDSTTRSLTVTDSNSPAYGLAVHVNNLTDGNYEGKVYLKEGKINQLMDEIDKLTNSETGTIAILIENYSGKGGIIDGIDKKIYRENRRLASKEREMKMKYSRLEATLSRYNGIQTQLASQVNKMNS